MIRVRLVTDPPPSHVFASIACRGSRPALPDPAYRTQPCERPANARPLSANARPLSADPESPRLRRTDEDNAGRQLHRGQVALPPQLQPPLLIPEPPLPPPLRKPIKKWGGRGKFRTEAEWQAAYDAYTAGIGAREALLKEREQVQARNRRALYRWRNPPRRSGPSWSGPLRSHTAVSHVNSCVPEPSPCVFCEACHDNRASIYITDLYTDTAAARGSPRHGCILV